MTKTHGFPRFRALSERASVSELELFFDLVFVYAITRVTDLMADTSWTHVLHAVLVLAVLWWVWVGYAWLGNVVKADHGPAKVAMFVAMAASFVLALSIPEAFAGLGGGGPLIFAIGYAVVRCVHLAAFWALSDGDAKLRGQLARWAPSIGVVIGLFLVASQTHGAVQVWLWVAALVVDYVGATVAGNDWRINSPGHFAERHGLIILIALGESIVEIGTGVANLPVSWAIVFSALLGLTLCALLWWTYFDMTAPIVEQALRRAGNADLIRIGRTCYTYLHLPMVAGIVGVSLGLEKVVAKSARPGVAGEHLSGIPLVLLFGGVWLYLVGLMVFKFYALRRVTAARVVTTVVVSLVAVAATALPALVSLALLTAILAAMVGYETVHIPELRAKVREGE
jgi:low temperature requirement protein LtrA